jgi:predicted Zn finger-like uncharacterized protein
MNIQCPICQTVFRVDPEKIPAGGVKARCSSCLSVFRLDPAAANPGGAPQPALAGAAATRAEAPRPSPRTVPERTSQPVVPSSPPPPAPPRRPSFLNQDPKARAQRIARALVSDIVAYNRDKLNVAQGAGTLRTEFREEIRKSWDEYVEQVGLELATKTPYFRDALNHLLAQGQKVF